MRRMYSENQIKEIIKSAIESGEIPSPFKLYNHEIGFMSNDITHGSLISGTAQPLCILSTRKEPYTSFEELGGKGVGGDGIISIINDDSVAFTELSYNENDDTLTCSNGLEGGYIYYQHNSNFTDKVTEI